jgi:hypothetical protein
VHLERTGRFTLPIPPDEALPFFSPEGERRWVAGWEPLTLHAPDGDLARAGAAFTTAVGGIETLWLVLEFDRERHHARSARITPGSRLGTVDVRCRPSDESGSEVEVTYALTSLTREGEAVLEAMSEAAYAEMLRDWERDVRAVI